jgi:hypothetical protein
MKALILTILTLFAAFMLHGQNNRLEISQLGIFSSEDNEQAKVYFNQEDHLNEIIISKAQSKKELPVWRVQIYQGSGKNARAEANSIRNNFKSKYPDVYAEWLYHSPYFKVHVGNFKTRLDAESFKKKIQSEYKSLWVISEESEVN